MLLGDRCLPGSSRPSSETSSAGHDALTSLALLLASSDDLSSRLIPGLKGSFDREIREVKDAARIIAHPRLLSVVRELVL